MSNPKSTAMNSTTNTSTTPSISPREAAHRVTEHSTIRPEFRSLSFDRYDQTTNGRDRRQFVRYTTPPMYHAISLRMMDNDQFSLDGHAYDLSLGGAQFELDDPIQPGTDVAMMIHLPTGFDAGPGRAIFVTGRIIWVGDIDDPGPVRMAMAFNKFARPVDEARLNRYLKRSQLRTAA